MNVRCSRLHSLLYFLLTIATAWSFSPLIERNVCSFRSKKKVPFLPLLVRRHLEHTSVEKVHGTGLEGTASSQSTTGGAPKTQQLGSFESLHFTDEEVSQRVVVLQDMMRDESDCLQYLQFETVWDYQKELLQHQVRRIQQNSKNEIRSTSSSISSFLPVQNREEEDGLSDETHGRSLYSKEKGVDTIIMLQHEPIYTLGTASNEDFIHQRTSEEDHNDTNKGDTVAVPAIRMDRGGEVTYHGPGQLVVYPILDLRSYKQDIHWYMRALEEAVIIALTSCGIQGAERQDDTTGVWVQNHKVAAFGVKCSRWVTMHGLAINIHTESLTNFNGIVPCGLQGRKVGCVEQFCDTKSPGQQQQQQQQKQQTGSRISIEDFAHNHLSKALEQVFQIKLVKID